MMALIAIGGTVLLVWPFFPINVIWGTTFGLTSTMTALLAVRAREPASKWALLLGAFSLFVQLVCIAAFTVPGMLSPA